MRAIKTNIKNQQKNNSLTTQAPLFLFFCLFICIGCLGGFHGCSDNSNEHADVLECEGSCECDSETRTCSCLGGSECIVEGEDDITLICEGNARCELECGTACHVECPGTAGCVAAMGDDSTAVCNGTGDCEYYCDGDCVVDCPGSSSCFVTCPEGSICEFTSCPEMQIQECEGGGLACRRDCPEISE